MTQRRGGKRPGDRPHAAQSGVPHYPQPDATSEPYGGEQLPYPYGGGHYPPQYSAQHPPPRSHSQHNRWRFFNNFCGCFRGPPGAARDPNYPPVAYVPPHPSSQSADAAGYPTHLTDPGQFPGGLVHVDPMGPLLGPQKEEDLDKKTLILDLDETLIHSSYTPMDGHAVSFLVEIERRTYEIYVAVRPGVGDFLRRVSESYEVVIFTASLPVYADKVIDFIDTENRVSHRLFRDGCVYRDGIYVKDLSLLGRDLSGVIIVDNCPQTFSFQPFNGIQIRAWYDDPEDRELAELFPLLQKLSGVPDIPAFIRHALQGEQAAAISQ